MSWVRHEHGWMHRPWWKVAINSVLRILQPWVRRKWVIYTRCMEVEQIRAELGGKVEFISCGYCPPLGHPIVLGYGFGRIDHGGAR